MGSAPSSFLSKGTFSCAASLLVLGRHPGFDSPIPSWLLWSFLRWSFLSFDLETPPPTTTFVDVLLPIAPGFPFRLPLILMLLPFADEWLSAWWKMLDVFYGTLSLHRENFSIHHNKTFTNQHVLDKNKKKNEILLISTANKTGGGEKKKKRKRKRRRRRRRRRRKRSACFLLEEKNIRCKGSSTGCYIR